MKIATVRRLVAATVLALAGWAQAQSLQVSTATELRASPVLNAKSLAALPVGAQVEQLQQQGGWLRVRFKGSEGWVRSTHVRSAAAAAPSAGGNPLTGISGVFSASSNTPTATTGTRGLTQEQLANAQPAPAEVSRMEGFAINAAQAQQFAQGGKLKAQPIPAYTGAEQ